MSGGRTEEPQMIPQLMLTPLFRRSVVGLLLSFYRLFSANALACLCISEMHELRPIFADSTPKYWNIYRGDSWWRLRVDVRV